MKCLIIAAGQGTRLQSEGTIKPLVLILGIPLIERVIRTAMEGGADEFYVVVGYEAEQISIFLVQLEKRLNIIINILVNSSWKMQNGTSVLQARNIIDEPFLLLMSDHLFDSVIIKTLLCQPINDGDVLLAVDENKNNPLVDMEDVTKVDMEGDYITNIGKDIDNFSAFDTGVFLCTPAIFSTLKDTNKINEDPSLSSIIKRLADHKQVKAVSVNNFWVDVDDKITHGKAEEALLAISRSKNNDGPIAHYLNRPISVRISQRLVNYNITPNQISFFSFICSAIAAGLFSLGNYWMLAIGGTLAQFASIIDGCDGEIARLKYLSSDFGGWFDAVLDRYADAFLLFGLTWYVYSQESSNLSLVIGFLAVIGSFMLSYTADKYDNMMSNHINKGMRIGRDIRIFLIFLGAIFNLAYLVLIAIAILMNLETIRRMVVCQDNE
ncbi:MAG: NTP transferase domain-containing protein [Piscirickettsiaceae bacterium]|nr:NTP transferase domain-containing protein [Piscirickettsiaceae bacterium]